MLPNFVPHSPTNSTPIVIDISTIQLLNGSIPTTATSEASLMLSSLSPPSSFIPLEPNVIYHNGNFMSQDKPPFSVYYILYGEFSVSFKAQLASYTTSLGYMDWWGTVSIGYKTTTPRFGGMVTYPTSLFKTTTLTSTGIGSVVFYSLYAKAFGTDIPDVNGVYIVITDKTIKQCFSPMIDMYRSWSTRWPKCSDITDQCAYYRCRWNYYGVYSSTSGTRYNVNYAWTGDGTLNCPLCTLQDRVGFDYKSPTGDKTTDNILNQVSLTLAAFATNPGYKGYYQYGFHEYPTLQTPSGDILRQPVYLDPGLKCDGSRMSYQYSTTNFIYTNTFQGRYYLLQKVYVRGFYKWDTCYQRCYRFDYFYRDENGVDYNCEKN